MVATYRPAKLSPWETQQFTTQRANARQQMLTGRAEIQQLKTRRGLDYRDQRRDMTTDWDRRRVQLPTEYIQRGVFNSGIYRGALQEYAQDRQRAGRDLQRGYQTDIQDLIMQQRRITDQYQMTRRQSRADELARRAQVAAELRRVL
jgi:hypothetical protein